MKQTPASARVIFGGIFRNFSSVDDKQYMQCGVFVSRFQKTSANIHAKIQFIAQT